MRDISILAAALAACLLSSAGCNWRQPQQSREADRSRTLPLAEPSAAIASYAEVVDRVTPAVVTIRSARRVRAARQFPFSVDPFFEEFFGRRFRQPQPQDRVQRGLGSGVIVREDGYCVTNHHVIDGAQEIRVEFADGTSYQAKLVGSDPPSDLAVLKLPASKLSVVQLGDSDRVRVGDVALAVGNPLGIGQTVTAGIISAKSRTTGLSDGSFEDFLQTDAPINQGNSGGALVNTAGELIGINSQILSPSGGNIGIGFAIPVNMMKDVLDQLVKKGEVRRGQLGVTIQAITPELASALKLEDRDGVLVSDVQSGSAADRAGLRRGDVITSINGNKIESTNRLRNVVSSMQPGTQVTVTVIREGKPIEVKVTLGEFQAETAQRQQGPGSGQQPRRLGLSVEPLTPQVASQLGIQGTEGLLVRDVDPGGPAAEAGLRPGDVIVQANRAPVRNTADLEKLVREAGENSVPLLVNRQGRRFFAAVRPR